MKKISFNPFDPKSVSRAIKDLNEYKKWIEKKSKSLSEKLAEIGLATASLHFETAIYDGDNDVVVTAEPTKNGWKIVAEGQSVCFIEFGSGVVGEGHPEASKYRMGVGTWSESENGKGHWNDPNGWYYAHGQKSFGNPPAMAMWEAQKEMKRRIENVAKEVFKT